MLTGSTIQKKRAVIISAIAVVAVLVGTWWWIDRPPKGVVVQVCAVDDGTAIVIFDGDSGEWVAHFDGDGRLSWFRELPGVTTYPATFVIGDIVTVRYSHKGEHGVVDQSVAAYALDDGRFLWDQVLSPIAQTPEHHQIPATMSTAFSAGGTLIESVDEERPDRAKVLYAIDPTSGQLLGHGLAGAEPIVPVRLHDRLVLHDFFRGVIVVDASHGLEATALDVGVVRSGCVIGDDYVTVVLDDYEHSLYSLVAFHHGDPASRRVLVRPFHPMDGRFSLRGCGRFRDRMVFEIVEDTMAVTVKTSIVIADANGSVLATVAMPFGSVDTERREVLAFSGELPRFVPYLERDETKREFDQSLAMVDLEQAKIAWVASGAFKLSDYVVFRARERWYVNNLTFGGDIVELDGATGKLVSAIRLPLDRAVQSCQIAGSKVWLYGTERRRLDNAPLAALDAKTLRPIFARGIETEDVTDQVRGELGIP